MVFSIVFITSFQSSFSTRFSTVFSQILAKSVRLQRGDGAEGPGTATAALLVPPAPGVVWGHRGGSLRPRPQLTCCPGGP